MFFSKFLKSLLASVCLCSFFACSEDEPNGGGANSDPTPNPPAVNQDAKLSVTISADGTTSNGAVFSQIDGTTFFLDYVKYKVVDSHLEIIGYDPVELPEIPKLYATVTIENTVYKTRIIKTEAFFRTKITAITIPETITGLYYDSFGECTLLTQITLPEGLTSIGGAFRNCTSLTQITLPEGLTSINTTFEYCTALTQITLPKTLTSIGNYAFSGCTALSHITLPEALTSIGEHAFSGCTALSHITLPEALTSIGKDAFSGCTSLTQITFPKSLTSIGEHTFSGCKSLTQITLPKAVTSIGEHTFSGCTSLTQTTLSEALTYIGYSAFSGCTSLTQITLPEALTSIRNCAFYGCALSKVTFLSHVCPSMDSAFDSKPTAYVRPEALDEYKNSYRWMFSEILPIDE